MRRGIVTGGTWCVDRNRLVDFWPPEEAVAEILEVELQGGGSACNLAIDIRRLDLSFPSIDESYLGLKESGVYLEEKPTELDLKKGETVTVELHVTGKQPGVLGMQAKVECVERDYDSSTDGDYKKTMADRYRCERQIGGMDIGTFEAVEILAPSREVPAKTFAAK